MGGIVSLCTSRPPSSLPSRVSLDPPDWADDEKSGKQARDVVEKISKLCAPLTVDRSGMHTVNVFTADRLSEQKSLPPLFRRVSSITPPIEGTANSLTEMWTAHRKELEVAIHKEKGKDHADPAPDLLSQEDRLRRRLSKLDMDMSVCRGDGNCLFRAISWELWSTEDYHASVRRKAVSYMRGNKEDFEPYLGEDFAQYTAKMERPGTWGDELTLRAVCDFYGIIINVVTSDQLNWFLRYMPKMLKHVKELFLTYVSPVHYNTIRRKDSLRALRPSLSLTRKSIIQAAIDKADQALQEMASIPEGPAVVEQRISASAQSQSAAPGSALAEQPLAAAPSVTGRNSVEESQRRSIQCMKSPFQEDYEESGQNLRRSIGNSANGEAVNWRADSPKQQHQQTSVSAPGEDRGDRRCDPCEPNSAVSLSNPDGSAGCNRYVLPGQVVENEGMGADQHQTSDAYVSTNGGKSTEGSRGVGTGHDGPGAKGILSARFRTANKDADRNISSKK